MQIGTAITAIAAIAAIFGFLLLERTSEVSPVIFVHSRIHQFLEAYYV